MSELVIALPFTGAEDLIKQLGLGGKFFAPVTRETLATLCVRLGTTRGALAVAVGVDPVLLERVDAHRQPLALKLAMVMAQRLGVGVGEVLGAAALVTNESTHQGVYQPLPPDADRGEDYTWHAVAPTVVPGVTPVAPRPSVWVVGDDGSGAPIASRIHRHSGGIDATVALTNPVSPVELALLNEKLWTVGSTASGGQFYSARLDLATAALEVEVASGALNAPGYLLAEPTTQTIWAANSGSTQLVKLDPLSGASLATVTVTNGVNAFVPQELIAADGVIYVLGQRGGGLEGRVFEIDPSAATVVRTSTGANLRTARGITSDGAGTLYVVGGTSPGYLCAVSTTTFAAVSVALSSSPSDPEQVLFAFDHVWISDGQLPGPVPQLLKVATDGTVTASATYSGSARLGHLASDGVFLWVSNPSEGHVRKLNPNDLTAVLDVTVGGAPRGILVV